MDKEILCKCGTVIKDGDIEHWNSENDEGEEYGLVEATCICGKNYQTTQWGEWKSFEEAKEYLNEYINPEQYQIEDEN